MSEIKVGDIVRIKLTSWEKTATVGIVLDLVHEGQDILTLLQNGAFFVDRAVNFRKL